MVGLATPGRGSSSDSAKLWDDLVALTGAVSQQKIPSLLFGGDMEVIVIQAFQVIFMWLLEKTTSLTPFHGYMLLLLLLVFFYYLGMILLPVRVANERLMGIPRGFAFQWDDLVMSPLTSESNGIPINCRLITRSH